MKLNNKGFSLIEILAVLVMSTVLLVPLMTSFTSTIQINDISQQRRNATSVASGTLYGLDKIDFSKFRTQLDDAYSSGDYYVEFNEDTCNTLTPPPGTPASADENFCSYIFESIWNNLEFDVTSFKVYLFNYNMTSTEFNYIINPNQTDQIMSQVQDEIANDTDITGKLDNPNITTLIRVVIWLDYYDDPDRYVTLSGLIADD